MVDKYYTNSDFIIFLILGDFNILKSHLRTRICQLRGVHTQLLVDAYKVGFLFFGELPNIFLTQIEFNAILIAFSISSKNRKPPILISCTMHGL